MVACANSIFRLPPAGCSPPYGGILVSTRVSAFSNVAYALLNSLPEEVMGAPLFRKHCKFCLFAKAFVKPWTVGMFQGGEESTGTFLFYLVFIL